MRESVSLRDSDHVWIDHNTFRDRLTADSTLPIYFGVLFQVHDPASSRGLLDTVSWTPTLFKEIDRTKKLPEIVEKGRSVLAPDFRWHRRAE